MLIFTRVLEEDDTYVAIHCIDEPESDNTLLV